MTEYRIEIKATLQARNLDSAQSKLERLKEKLEPLVDSTEIEMVGQEADRKGVGEASP